MLQQQQWYITLLCCFMMTCVVVFVSSLPAHVGYDESYARAMMYLSAGAYAENPDDCIKRAMPTANKWVRFSSADRKCDVLNSFCSFYIAISDYRSEIIVVFRGSKNVAQLLAEGLASLQPAKNFFGLGKVNGYFFKGLEVLWNDIHEVLVESKYEHYNVTFTGHSLGGALASLASIRTVIEGIRTSQQVKLYTFGQPRTGGSSYAFAHDRLVPHSYRIVHSNDIVPHIPPCVGDIFNLRNKPCDPETADIAYHHGTEIWYPGGMGPDDKYKICKGEPRNEDFSCSEGQDFHMLDYIVYIPAHRNYFEHQISKYKIHGCSPNVKEDHLQNENESNDSSKLLSFRENCFAIFNCFGKLNFFVVISCYTFSLYMFEFVFRSFNFYSM